MRKVIFLVILTAVTIIPVLPVFSQAIIIDHNCTDLSKIPEAYINSARGNFKISYGHTSHGSQLISGMNNIYNQYGNTYDFNHDGDGGALSLHDSEPEGDLGHNGDLSWYYDTRDELNQAENTRNLVIWSWCGGVSDNTEEGINSYLNHMNQLESDYPAVRFIYMTGHLDIWSYDNLTARNQQIRDYCNAHGKVLFDFADIESYDPSGTHYQYANDDCTYYSDSTGNTELGNWAIQWCSSHSGDPLCYGDNSSVDCGCAHSVYLNCNLKGRAFWWMMARLAGWDGSSAAAESGINSGDYNGDGTADLAVFRPSSGLWAVRGVTRVYFGGSSDTAAPGDYNGDGTTDVGLYRSSSGLWAVSGVTRLYFGGSSDQPIPSDYDGDGACDPGIFRPSSGLWAVSGITRAYFGSSSDTALPGDYNGDGTADIGLYRSSSGLWAIQGMTRAYFGGSSDSPVAGDYSGDGTRQIGIYRSSSGLWAIRGVTRVYFGGSSDSPVPADYNGDGTDATGIFRSASGLWAIRGISRAYFGASGDRPVTR